MKFRDLEVFATALRLVLGWYCTNWDTAVSDMLLKKNAGGTTAIKHEQCAWDAHLIPISTMNVNMMRFILVLYPYVSQQGWFRSVSQMEVESQAGQEDQNGVKALDLSFWS